MTFVVRCIVLSAWLVAGGNAVAHDMETIHQADITSDRWNVSVYSGYLTGQATERVYNSKTGAKISHLNWQIDKALVLGGSIDFKPFDWLTLRLGGWTHIDAASAMDNFDWIGGYHGFQSWTHWSHHDTAMTRAMQIDLSVAARLWQREGFQISARGGYKELHFKWKSYGGAFVYSDEEFRDFTGIAPDLLTIAYRQDWHIPYVGLSARLDSARWTLTADITGSLFGWSSDVDHHIARATVFDASFRHVRTIGASVGAEYRVARNVSLFANADYQRVMEARGPLTGNEYQPEPTYVRSMHCSRCAGASLETAIVSFGVKANW